MANVADTTRAKDRVSEDRVYEDFKPSSRWVEESNCQYLLVDLPDFKKEEIKIQSDSVDHVMVSGGRRVKDNKFIYFNETYKVPENSDIMKTSGRLEDGLLTVRVPKLAMEKEDTEHPEQDLNKERHDKAHRPPESKVRGRKSSGERFYSDEINEKWREERSILRSAMKMFNRNRGIIITTVLAFSLGVWVYGKFNLGGHGKALE